MYSINTYGYGLAFALLTIAGCPEPAPSDPETGSTTHVDEATTSLDSTTTGVEPTTVSVDSTTTADPSTSSTTSNEDSTTAALDDTSTTSAGDSTTEDATTGEPFFGGYGDCANGGLAACEPYENCLARGFIGVCGGGNCGDASDCPIPDLPGAPPVVCEDVSGRGTNDCVMECQTWADCPETMLCINLGTRICMWPTNPPGGGVCPDIDLGTRVPQTYVGNSIGLFDDYVPPCSFGGGEEAFLRWTAPADGSYTFDTIGSGFDTALAILSDCPAAGGALLDCNDDGVGLNFDSQLTRDFLAGESVVIVVDGYDQDVGPFTLNIQ